MTADVLGLSMMVAAAGVAVIHTLLGPDHYLPFVMLARARRWSSARVVLITVACGLGHVASSVALGGLGIVVGLAVGRLEQVESGRGSLAAWALVAFGIAYAVWGARRAVRRARGLEPHAHRGHVHLHGHGDEPHAHGPGESGARTTFWALFVIFVLGPCEPLIPLFVLPASRGDWGLAAGTAGIFALVTIVTMVATTAGLLAGYRLLPLGRLERWSHSLAGLVIAASGLAILVLGV